MKKMYSINDIGAQLGLCSREASGPRGMSSGMSLGHCRSGSFY